MHEDLIDLTPDDRLWAKCEPNDWRKFVTERVCIEFFAGIEEFAEPYALAEEGVPPLQFYSYDESDEPIKKLLKKINTSGYSISIGTGAGRRYVAYYSDEVYTSSILAPIPKSTVFPSDISECSDDSCVHWIAIQENDHSRSNKAKNPDFCLSSLAELEMDQGIFRLMSDSNHRCYWAVALSSGDISVCNNIKTSWGRAVCVENFAEERGDESVCYNLSEEDIDSCLNMVNSRRH